MIPAVKTRGPVLAAAWCLALLPVAGCAAPSTGSVGGGSSTTARVPTAQGSSAGVPTTQTARFEAARREWAASGLRDYDLVVDRRCFCPVTGPVKVEVRGAVVVGTSFVTAEGSPPPTGLPEAQATTVPDLFDTLGTLLGYAEKISVTYGDHGVPTSIVSQGKLDTADDEVTYAVRFTPVPDGGSRVAPPTAAPTLSPTAVRPPAPRSARPTVPAATALPRPRSGPVPSAGPSVQGGPAPAAPTTLAQARRVWASAGVRSYSFQVTRACFCAYRGTVEVTVRAGAAAGMRMLPMDGGGDPGPIPRDTPPTVEALLDLVATEQRTAARVSVTFDRHGVPVRIASDRIADAVDDEITYLVTFSPA